jgi:hypothetical protein
MAEVAKLRQQQVLLCGEAKRPNRFAHTGRGVAAQARQDRRELG